MLSRADRARARLVWMLLLTFSIGACNARVQTQEPHRASEPPKILTGEVQLGAYEPLGVKGQAKLWLTRFTAPAVLMNYDVVFAYDRKEFCALPHRPGPRDFYTPRFAVARKGAASSLDVDTTFQIKKVDFCTAEAGKAGEYVILSKELMGDLRPAITINWQSKGSIGGLSVSSVSPGEKTDALEGEPKPSVPTASLSLNRIYLDIYREALGQKGIELKSELAATSARQTPFAMMATGAASAVAAAVAPPSPRGAELSKNYCFIDIGADEKVCDDNFAKITERVLAAAEAPRSFATRTVSAMEQGQRQDSPRFVLRIRNAN